MDIKPTNPAKIHANAQSKAHRAKLQLIRAGLWASVYQAVINANTLADVNTGRLIQDPLHQANAALLLFDARFQTPD